MVYPVFYLFGDRRVEFGFWTLSPRRSFLPGVGVMSLPIVELDFFAMEKDSSSSVFSASSSNKSQFQKFLQSQRSFRGIETGAISKISPQILKSLISASPVNVNELSENVGRIELKGDQRPPHVQSVPASDSFISPSSDNVRETAPLTIFYNETVAVLEIPREKAASTFRFAEEENSKPNAEKDHRKLDVSSTTHLQQLLYSLRGDMPISRRKSLQIFLEKRRERLAATSPYACRANQEGKL